MNPAQESQEPTQKDRYFRGQGPDEQVLAFCRKHWITLLPHFSVFLVATIAAALFIINFSSLRDLYTDGLFQFLVFFFGLMLLYFVHHFFHVLIRHNLSVMIFTDCRIISIHKSLFLINEKEMVDLGQIQEVQNLQSGLLQNVFNFGNLFIVLSATNQGIYLEDVPHPDFHFRLINKTKQAYLIKHPYAPPPAASGSPPTDDNLQK